LTAAEWRLATASAVAVEAAAPRRRRPPPGGGFLARKGRDHRPRAAGPAGRSEATPDEAAARGTERSKAEARRRQAGRGRRFGRGVADLFEIPEDVVLNVPRITIIGNLQMIIENHRGLIEYSPGTIRVGTGDGQLVILGEDLAVGSVFAEDLSIMGRFSRLVFEEMTDESQASDRRSAPDRGRGSPTGGNPTGGEPDRR